MVHVPCHDWKLLCQHNVKELLVDALSLSALERAALADELFASLDRADARIDARSGRRKREIDSPRSRPGEMKTMPAEDVFAEFENR